VQFKVVKMSFFKLPFAKTAGHKKYQLCSITASEGDLILGDVLFSQLEFDKMLLFECLCHIFLFQEVFYK